MNRLVEIMAWHCHEVLTVAVALGLLALWVLLYCVMDEWLVTREYHALMRTQLSGKGECDDRLPS